MDNMEIIKIIRSLFTKDLIVIKTIKQVKEGIITFNISNKRLNIDDLISREYR